MYVGEGGGGGGGVIATASVSLFSIQDVTACLEYPVHNYTLVVEDSEGNRATQTSQATGDIVEISISGLKENSCYSYHVIATNQFGESRPSIACKCIEIIYNLVIVENWSFM